MYDGPATLDVQYAIVGRTPTVRPRLGDRMCIAGLSVQDHDWPSYDPRQHLQPDGSLVIDTFILELFDEDRDDQPATQRMLPRDPLR